MSIDLVAQGYETALEQLNLTIIEIRLAELSEETKYVIAEVFRTPQGESCKGQKFHAARMQYGLIANPEEWHEKVWKFGKERHKDIGPIVGGGSISIDVGSKTAQLDDTSTDY